MGQSQVGHSRILLFSFLVIHSTGSTASSGHHYLNPEEYPISKAVPVSAEAGDILLLNYFTVHGSYPNVSENSRRILLVQVFDPLDEPLKEVHMSPGRGLILFGENPVPELRKRGGGAEGGGNEAATTNS